MPGGYTGEIQDFTNAHQRVIQVNESVTGILKQVQNQVMSLQGAWTGAAATAFSNLMARYNDDAVRLNQALQAIAEQLQAAGSTYEAQEESKQSSFGNIGNQLGG